jgi:hypothetical protein
MSANESQPQGSLTLRRVPLLRRPAIADLADALKYGTPRRRLRFFDRAAAIRREWQQANQVNFERSIADQDAHDGGRLAFIGHLWLAKVDRHGGVQDYGLASCRIVTTTGVGFIVDAFQNLVELENMKFHGLGTGGAAEAAANTALTTELTTQYAVASTRPTGSTGEKSGDATCYETSATITVSATVAATEHGVFSQAAVAGGVLLDRTLFTVVNLDSSESIQATYQMTFPAGGA